MQSIIILSNPKSGPERRFRKAYKKILTKVAREGISFRIYNLIEEIPPNQLKIADRLIVLGGDGTLNFAAKYLYDNGIDIPIGIIPVGSANIFAYTLNIPYNLNKAIKVALEGVPKKIYPGIINHKTIFILATSTGVHAELMKKTPRWTKKLWGNIAYYIRLPLHLALIKRHDYSISFTSGKRIQTKASGIFIFNGFKGIPGEPFNKMNLFEPKLYILILEIANALEFFHALTSIFIRGKIPEKGAFYFETASFTIEFTDAFLYLDGEEDFTEKKLEISIAPKSIQFFVPK